MREHARRACPAWESRDPARRVLWRDVLPTAAHRWAMQQPGSERTLDCVAVGQESESIAWLTGGRIGLPDRTTGECTEPDIGQRLTRAGYARLIVRRNTAEGAWFLQHPVPDGLRPGARFAEAQVFTVTTPAPAVYIETMAGFFPRERDAEWSWRWMGRDGAWIVVNSRRQPLVATVSVDLSAFHQPRRMEVRLDGSLVQTLVVDPGRRVHEIGPLVLPPGGHALVFQPTDAPTVANEVAANGDPRPLSFALGTVALDGAR